MANGKTDPTVLAQLTWIVDKNTGTYAIERLTRADSEDEPTIQYDTFPSETKAMMAFVQMMGYVSSMFFLAAEALGVRPDGTDAS